MKNREVAPLIGWVFGALKVIAKGETSACGVELYECECECGNKKMVPRSRLTEENNKECTCLFTEVVCKKGEDLTGKRFGKLIVLEKAEYHISKSGRKRPQWKCLCDCGKECIVVGENLRSGNTQSCGCTHYEKRGLQGEDLTGQRFGKLVVVKPVEERTKDGKIQWLCICDCGNETFCKGYDLKSGRKKSCGCNQQGQDGSRAENITGKVFGRLKVKCRVDDYVQPNGRKRAQYLCECECGNECIVTGENLRNGTTKSCGCLADESRKTCRLDHGMSHSVIYNTWCNMKQRCYNPNNAKYKNYGARGITVCDEWVSDFNSFYNWSINNGWEDGLTIDRINNDKGYSPDNCRWTDLITQANNRSHNAYIDCNGEVHTISEWCNILGIKNKSTVYLRHSQGIDGEKLFENVS